MAVALEKIIRISAQTRGQQGLAEMDRMIRRLGPGAEASVTGVLRLNRVLGDMGTIAGGIGLAGLGSSLLAFGRNSLQAGDDSLLVARRMATLGDQAGETARMMEFARTAAERFSTGQLETSQAVADLYARLRPMGVSLADIETTFNGVNKAARLAGLSASDQTEAFTQLAQAMGSGRLQGDELRSLMERMPQIGNAIVKVFNDIAASKGLEQITKARANVLVQEVKDGEKRQTQVLKDEMRNRQELAEKETDAMLKEVNRRYDELLRSLERNFQDRDEKENRAIDRRLKIQREGISEQYEEERKNLERIYEDRFDALNDDKAINDERKKQIRRNLEDQRSVELEEIEKREQAQIEKLEESAQEENKIRARTLEDQRRQQEQALRDQQQAEEDSLRQELENRQQIMEKDLEKTIEKNKKANEDMIASILARVKVTQGDLKQMGADGLITTDIMIQAMKELEKLQPPKATALQEFNTALKDLSQEVGDNLLPSLTPLIQGLTVLAEAFGRLPEPIQTTIVGITALGIAIGALKFAGILGGIGSLVGLLGKLGGALVGIRFAATIAGWAGAVGPAVGTITTALTGLLAWMGGTFVPAMVAFFSGPVGWIALGVAALIAGIVLFREPIMNFLGWAVERITEFWKGVVDLFEMFKQPLGNALKNMTWLFTHFWTGVGKLAYNLFIAPFVKVFSGLWELIREPLGIALENVQAFFSSLGNIAAIGFKMVADFLYWLLIDPWVKWWGEAKWAATQVITSIAPMLEAAWSAISTTAYLLLVDPWVKTWNELQTVVSNMAKSAVTLIQTMWTNIIKLKDGFLSKWGKLWELVTSHPESFKQRVSTLFTELYRSVTDMWKGIPAMFQNIWQNVTDGMSRIWRTMTSGVRKMLNDIIGIWNGIASKTKPLPGFAQLPIIPSISEPQAFARGGFVSQPTLGFIGEGRNPREYVIPEGGMDAAAAGWQAGLRGNQLVAAWQSPGLAPGRATTTGAMASGPVQITITGGTVQLPDGRQAVTLDQVEAIATAITRSAAPGIVRASVQASGGVMTSAAGRARYGLS